MRRTSVASRSTSTGEARGGGPAATPSDQHTVTDARNEGMEVHRFGSSTAIVTGWLVMRGRGPGGPFDRRYRFTDSWVRTGGRWRIVAAQDYLAPEGGR